MQPFAALDQVLFSQDYLHLLHNATDIRQRHTLPLATIGSHWCGCHQSGQDPTLAATRVADAMHSGASR